MCKIFCRNRKPATPRDGATYGWLVPNGWGSSSGRNRHPDPHFGQFASMLSAQSTCRRDDVRRSLIQNLYFLRRDKRPKTAEAVTCRTIE